MTIRIVHIIKAIRVAGAEQHLLTLLAGLRARGVDAQMILLVNPDNNMQDYVDLLTARGIPVQRMVIQRHTDVMIVRRLIVALRDLKPDIVHTHLIHADLFGTLAARLAGVRIVISSRHNDDAFRYRLPIRLLNRVLWRMTDAGIGISDSITRFSIAVEGARANQIQRIHYGLELGQPLDKGAARAVLLKEFGLNAEAILVGVACRLVEQKGIGYGLEAFARLKDDFPNAYLLIAGEGTLRGDLEAQAKRLGLDGRVHFLGWRADNPRFLAGLDMLLSPSLWEGFGLVLLEAMAQQTPIIASDVSAIPEVVVSEATGLLVSPRDVEVLTEALVRLLADKPLRAHLGMMGRERAEDYFSAAHMVDETLGVYERYTKNPGV